MSATPAFSLTTGTVWQTLPTAADIAMNMVVMHSINGVIPFEPLDSNIHLIAGVSSNEASIGQNSLCVSHGIVVNGSSFTPGPYYAGPAGTLLTSPPSSGLVLQIGYAISSDTMIISIQQPAAVKGVFSIKGHGNGTTTYQDNALIGADILLLQTDGVGRIEGEYYSFASSTGTITFGSILKTQQSLIVLFSL